MPTPSVRRRSIRQGRSAPRLLVPGIMLGFLAVLTIAILAGRGPTHRGGSGDPSGVLTPGTAAPGVVLPATTGQTVDLSTFRGRRNVLLYFYEHAG